MRILVTMAGDAKRFEGTEFSRYKPFVEVRGKTILDWTLSSLPNIHSHHLAFAIREDHDELCHVSDRLQETYPDAGLVTFKERTRGNLETAMLSVMQWIPDYLNEPLLVLDCDNYFDGSTLFEDMKKTIGGVSVVAFEPKDDSDKWCFAVPDKSWKGGSFRVKRLMEKDGAALKLGGKPMVGAFYFCRASWLLMAGAHVIADGKTAKGEYFMSQAVDWLATVGVPVGCVMVDNVIPLGTPEDVRAFQNESLH